MARCLTNLKKVSVDDLIKRMQKTDIVCKAIISRLRNELPVHLTYHNAQHTEAVVLAAEMIGVAEGINEEEAMLIKTAAAFHDAGFLITYKDHEEASCKLAQQVLPPYGFSSQEIDTICGIIMATKLPQRPATTLQKIICDADLHYLGTQNYMLTADKLYEEFKSQKLVSNRRKWYEKQIRFLSNHQFFTVTAHERYDAAKQAHLKVLTSRNDINQRRYSFFEDIVMTILGVLFAGFALKGFLVPNHFFDGGITGISLLAHEVYHLNLAYVIIAFNLPLIIAGFFWISKTFALKTFASVALLGLCLLFVPYPAITSDKLLISIFGGVFLGLGIGLNMRAGAALDGIEILALYTLKRTSFTITEIILGLNILIFFIAAFRFGMETALYSMLTYFAASKLIDYVIEGIQAYTGVTIISGESETIKHRLVNELGRGITVFKGERGFLPGKFEVSSDCDIIFTIVSRLELRKLKIVVYDADPKAFVFANTIKEASGGILKRRAAH